MPGLSSFLTDFVKRIGSTLVPSVKTGFQLFKDKADGISLKDMLADLFSILRNVWVFFVFVIITTFIFTSLPQGSDILLVVVEDVGVEHDCINLFWLVVGIVFWAVITEYGARYSIYVSDNSGRNFLEKRVQWRIALQKVIAASFLVLPFLSILFSLTVLYFNNTSLNKTQKNIGFGVTAFIIYLVFNLVSRPYLDRIYRLRKRREAKGFWRLFLIPSVELKYAEKLFGIYNNYVFALPKETWFNKKYRSGIEAFYKDAFLKGNNEIDTGFPQNETKHFLTVGQDNDSDHEGKVVPDSFKLVYPMAISNDTPVMKDNTSEIIDIRDIRAAKKEEKLCEENPNGLYRWEYKVPFRYFKILHRQLTILSIVSLLIICIFSCGSISFYQWIGSPGLVFFSFGAWSGISIGLLYLDKAVFPKFPISIRALLLLWLLFCSVTNDDHPVRSNGLVCCDDRPTLQTHFAKWIAAYKSDTTNRYYKLTDTILQTDHYLKVLSPDSNYKSYKVDAVYPVTFICAEGGALRTGGFAALVLANLQDTLERREFDMTKTVYAMSGVSGGAFGLGYFNAVNYLNDRTALKPLSNVQLAKSFFSKDYLAPTLGKLLYGDVINQFLPFDWKVDRFDRAIGLEKSWEQGYNCVISQHSPNIFSSDFRSLYCSTKMAPAFFINTTEVETGLQCWISNVKPDSLPLAGKRDLLSHKVNKYINYSTAINFSSRFPLFSPGAMVKADDKKYHYVDGGYVENTGASTMIEILNYLRTETTYKKIIPCVLVIKFKDNSLDEYHNLDFGNELSEAMLGIYNTRSGRAEIAEATLKKLIEKELKGFYIPFSLSSNGKEVPMNWIFSTQSINNINADIKQQFDSVWEGNPIGKFKLLGR